MNHSIKSRIVAALLVGLSATIGRVCSRAGYFHCEPNCSRIYRVTQMMLLKIPIMRQL